MNTSTKTILHASLWLLAALTVVSVILFTGRISFVHADDTSTTDTSAPTDTASSGDNTITGTYTTYSDGSSSLSADCGNVSNCDSVSYDNLTVYNYSVDQNTGQTTANAYVDGQYVQLVQVDAGDGYETWAYQTPAGTYELYTSDTGGGSSDNTSTDTGGTGGTTNPTVPISTSCTAFASNCSGAPPSSASAPCATATCTTTTTSTPPPTTTPIPTPNLTPPPAAPPVPFLWIDANPHLVRSGSSSTISWGATNVQSCNVKLNGTTVYSGTSGTRDVGNITSQRVYTLECVGIGGGFTVTTAVQISIVPKWEEI